MQCARTIVCRYCSQVQICLFFVLFYYPVGWCGWLVAVSCGHRPTLHDDWCSRVSRGSALATDDVMWCKSVGTRTFPPTVGLILSTVGQLRKHSAQTDTASRNPRRSLLYSLQHPCPFASLRISCIPQQSSESSVLRKVESESAEVEVFDNSI